MSLYTSIKRRSKNGLRQIQSTQKLQAQVVLMSIYDLSRDQLPRALRNNKTPQDPEWWYDQVANNPWPISELYQMQINKELRKEAKQRDQDLYQNTGQSWKNSPYPFMAYNESYSGRNNYGTGDMFEATEKIISLYYNRWKKW